MSKKNSLSILFGFLLTTAQGATNNQDSQFNQPIGAGIANPSYHTAIRGQNPAGLAYANTKSLKIAPFWSMQSVGASHTFNGDLMWGSSFLGVGGGISYVMPSVPGATASLNANFGMSLATRAIAVGASGAIGISPSSSAQMKLGAILFPYSRVRIGYVYHGLVSGTRGHSAGLALDVGRMVTLVADAGADSTFQRFSLAPSLGVALNRVKFSGGFGFPINATVATAPTAPAQGLFLSITGELSKKLLIFGNYQTIHLMSAGLIVTL